MSVQKKKAPDYENTDTAMWLGKRHAVIIGVVEGGDPQVQAEIEDWCRTAQVRRRFRDTNLAQNGRPYPGMMDLYIDETNLYHRMFLYTKQFDWEKMCAIADDIADEVVIRVKAQDILDTFDIEDGSTIEKVWEMADVDKMSQEEYRIAAIEAVKKLSSGVGIPVKLETRRIQAWRI